MMTRPAETRATMIVFLNSSSKLSSSSEEKLALAAALANDESVVG